MVYNIIGSIIRSITIITLWVVFWKYYEMIINHMWKFMLWLFVIIWIYIYKFKKEEFMQYMKEKNEEVEMMSKK